ncbi:RNA polymerase sigma factor [Carboxylicivirga mesophila]|uniref:RNA polymerase sigma factor n=1 Tax=Carboxylicivirga mesophila TaxID=1166478 RepID=A0ABS5KC17_9BACT|nr:RNA polymerase sigma factor [Carboxylicivirga mesophila]MBS2212579.1 RNA polymerase sigma factor [Carboxylicivirga mesophila]
MTVEEFNQAVNQYSDSVYRFILKNIKDEDKAKDIIQDTYEKLWKKHDEVNFLKVKSYLFSAAYHTLIDLTRREKKQALWDDVDFKNHSHTDGYTDLNEVLHQAVERLPETQRMVVMMRDYEGYSYKEISEITKLSEAQVKVYIFRARKFLKEYIGNIEVLV